MLYLLVGVEVEACNRRAATPQLEQASGIIAALTVLHTLLRKWRARPTYLVTYSAATSPHAASMLRDMRKAGTVRSARIIRRGRPRRAPTRTSGDGRTLASWAWISSRRRSRPSRTRLPPQSASGRFPIDPGDSDSPLRSLRPRARRLPDRFQRGALPA